MRQKKLVLKKTTIADLNQRQMSNIFGGRDVQQDSNNDKEKDLYQFSALLFHTQALLYKSTQ